MLKFVKTYWQALMAAVAGVLLISCYVYAALPIAVNGKLCPV